LKELPDISTISIIGGCPRLVTIDLDPSALASRQLDPLAVRQALARVNVRTTASGVVSHNEATSLEAGGWLASVDAIRRVIVGVSDGAPVQLGDVANIHDGGGEPDTYVMQHPKRGEGYPAV